MEGTCEMCKEPTDHSNILTDNETEQSYIVCNKCTGKEDAQDLVGSAEDMEDSEEEDSSEEDEDVEGSDDAEEPKQAKKKNYA